MSAWQNWGLTPRRLEQTINAKTGKRCEVIWQTDGTDGAPVRYDFEALFHQMAPVAREQLEVEREKRQQEREARREGYDRWDNRPALELIKGGRHGLKRICYRELAWHRLEDLRALAALRATRNGSLEGERMAFLFWSLNFLGLSNAVSPSSLWKEAQSLATTLAPGWRYERGELSTLYRKLCAYVNGETVEFNGRQYPGLYTPRNQTLIELFKITPDEQRHLKTIISKEEARHRDAERKRSQRREAGAVERSTYLESMAGLSEQRREAVLALKAKGLSQRAIAKETGLSKTRVAQLLAQA